MEPGYSLDPDEVISQRINRHWIALAPVIVTTAMIALIIIGGSYLISRYRDQIPAAITTELLAGLMGIMLVIAVFILLAGFWVYRRNYVLLTNRHIIRMEQRGLFSRNVSQLSLSRVQDVSSSVPNLVATILGYGEVTIQTAGEEENFLFSLMPHPAQLADSCLIAHDSYMKETATPASSGVQAGSTPVPPTSPTL